MAESLKTVRLVADYETILRYARITGDFNPIHVDAAFAATTAMGGIIAHGTMSMNLIWQSLRMTLGEEAAKGGTLDIRFARPVRVGDTVEAGGVAQPETPGCYAVWVRNQDGVNVIEGTLQMRQQACEL